MGEKGGVWWRTVLMKGYDSSYSAMTGHSTSCAVYGGRGGGGGVVVINS